MKKQKLLYMWLVIILFTFLPLTNANAAAVHTSYEGSSYHDSHNVNDFVTAQAIKVDDTFNPKVNTQNSSQLQISKSILRNSSNTVTNFYQNWGKTQLMLSTDGIDQVSLYDIIASATSNAKNVTAEKKTYLLTTYYIMSTISLSSVSLTPEEAVATYSTFKSDHPEIYWLDFNILYTLSSDGKNVKNIYLITTSNYDTPNERKTVDDKISSKVAEYKKITDGLTTNYAKEKAVHDKMINEIDYLYENRKPSVSLYAHNIVGILDGTGGVCEGYARAYQYILNLLNIPNLYVQGTAVTSIGSGGHAWNMAMADNGFFYYVDTTWDDKGSEGIVYDYFLSGSTTFDIEHKPDQPSGVDFSYQYALPKVPADQYNSADGTTPVSIDDKISNISDSTYAYDGTAKTPIVTVDGLTYGLDYQVYYLNNVNAGTGTAYVIGIGNYTGVISKTFTITKADFDNSRAANITVIYDTQEHSLTIPAPKGSDITYSTNSVTYSDIVPSYTEVGSYTIWYKYTNKNYNGSISGSATITINPMKILNQMFALTTTTFQYTGSSILPDLVISGLSENVDYKVQYTNNTNPGQAYLTITGIGNYTGLIKKSFLITKKSINSTSIRLSSTSLTYKGTPVTPTVTIKNGTKTLIQGKDFKITFTNNINPGKASLMITGLGNYSSKTTKTYTIKIGTPSVTVSTTKKSATIKWKKVTGVTGYEVSYSTASKGKYSIIKTVSANTASLTKSGLKSGKTYYFKVRAYKTLNGKKVYGSYSTTRLIKVK